MKRSKIGPKTYAEALSKAQKRQAVLRARLQAKSTADGKIEHKKSLSQAALAGKKRRNAKKREIEKKEREFKKQVRERDNYTCQWPLGCDTRDEHIHVHHKNQRSQRPDEKYNPENAVCLCDLHHDQLHHTVRGRTIGREHGLLGGETYEASRKRND